MLGSDAEVKLMLQMFIDLTPNVLIEMEDALQKENWVLLGELAHKVKSSFRLMGMKKMVEEAYFIEKNGREKTLIDQLEPKFHALKKDVLEIIELMKIDIQTMGA